jgi:hypothetical protein
MGSTRSLTWIGLAPAVALFFAACTSSTSTSDAAVSTGADGSVADASTSTSDSSVPLAAKDPATAAKPAIDRFSDTAGHLQKRSASPSLPGPNQPVDFDQGPFITAGFGPHGEKVKYYNFDVQPTQPAPIYAFFTQGGALPVAGQLNVVDVIPGAGGYSDFWQVNKVIVPDGYLANSVTSYAEIVSAGYSVQPTTMLVNCPIVPEGSTATLRVGGGDTGLQTGWYRGMTVRYFSFEEKALSGGTVPLSPIFVAFNVNPDKPNGGPPSGFKTELGSAQTHNVTSTLPTDPGYSPLWMVDVYDNAAFDSVKDLATAGAAKLLAPGAANVNCPIVEIK